VSVEEYYFNVYSYSLKYPDLPALDVGNKKKPTFIPLEVNVSIWVSFSG
jgi:eukaryotic translation initiation factor 2C